MTDTLALMAAGFMHAISPINLLAMLASTIVGITIGCLPGLSAAMGVALLLPVTFGMDPATGLIVLGGIYCGAIFGGSISAILIHTPGTPASAATAIEGYQLTLRGKAAKALFTAFHAVNGGSNPPGDAKNFNRLQQLSFWVTKIGLQFFLRRLSLEEFLF